jgi:hypothetical protein
LQAVEKDDVTRFRTALNDLLELARLRCLERVTALQLPLEVDEQVLLVEQGDGNSWSAHTELHRSSAFGYWPPDVLFGVLGDDGTAAALAVAQRLVDIFGDDLRHWTFTTRRGLHLSVLDHPVADFDLEPGGYVACRMVFPVVLEHLQRLATIGNPDPTLAERLADEILAVASEPEFRFVAQVAISGVETGGETLVCGPVSLRPLSPIERGTISDVDQPGVSNAPAALTAMGSRYPWYGLAGPPTHTLEVSGSYPKTSPAPDMTMSLRAVLLAAFLHGFDLAGPGTIASVLRPEWRGLGAHGTPVPIASYPATTKTMSIEAFQGICETAWLLDMEHVLAPSNQRELALHRSMVGAARDNSVDALLDFVIALEAVLLPYDPEARRAELSYRFRLHGSLFLADDAAAREEAWRDLNEIYDLRSRSVHGGRYPSAAEFSEGATKARRMVARCLFRAVHQGFPDAATFKKQLLENAAAWTT